MRTDKLYYLVFQQLPEGFFVLIGRDPKDADLYDFKSVELKEIAFRIDGVFVPKVSGQIVYFLEVQFHPDPKFYSRLFAEIFIYLRQYQPQEWQVVILYPDRATDVGIQTGYQELLASNRVRRVYLNELPKASTLGAPLGLLKLVSEAENDAADSAKQMVKNAHGDVKIIDVIEQIISYKFSKLNREEVKAMLGLKEELLKDTQFYKDIYEEGRKQTERDIAKMMLSKGFSIKIITEVTGLSETEIRKLRRPSKPPRS